YGKMPKKEFVGTGDYVIFSGYKYTESYPEKNTSAGELIVVARGVGGTGDVKITTRDCYLTNLSIKINLDETKVRKEYFYYLFLQSNLRYLDSGSAQSQITINDLANVEISAPSLNVQDLIVKSLKAFDDKITTLSSMNQTLEQMSQTLFKSWFVDFDPVIDNALDAGNPIPEALQTRAKLRQKVRNSADFKPLPAEIRSLFPSEFEETELGWVPKGWKEGTLPEIAFINSTSWTNKNQPDYINYVDLSNAKDGRIYSIEKLSFNDAPSRARRILKKDDLIFGLVRPANRSFAYVHVDGLTGSTGFAVIRAQKTIYKNFIYYFVTYDKNIEELARIADGGAYPAIKPDDICTLPLIIPSINIIEKFDELTSNFREMMNNSLIQNEYLTNLRGTLLPKLISGELSLEDLPDLTTDTEAA
ncbi:TPA: restriction endonuclease subunit S, partial [Escherichia coli]|nr:restriction endonuclease subunit S [Escherichia coli]HAH6852487.1 restriction endonuclease subunit S [Escherichia coli]HAX3473188.1 restriction endonuclease subunit S [Escherichia coli]